MSAALQQRSLLNRYWRVWPMRLIYGWVDAVVAVSQGVKTDTLNITRLAEEKISVIRNPVLTDALQQINETVLETVPHPWLEKNRQLPVIMAAGRLSQQKDFTTLINAFQQVQLKQPCRLIILGEGRLRGELEQQIAKLGLAEQVLLPGFQANIHHWLKPADLFVLSSRWEGSPNVLTEALALGVPVVSTACPSGPDELLQQQGQNYGVLVPVGDADALADAIIETLKNPPTKQFLRQAVHAYTVQQSSAAYLQLLMEAD